MILTIDEQNRVDLLVKQVKRTEEQLDKMKAELRKLIYKIEQK